MKIALIEYYDEPVPTYRVLAAELRKRGHSVWLGATDKAGNLRWHDGEREFAVLKGPPRFTRRGHSTWLWRGLDRLLFLEFMLRLRAFLQQHEREIVHVNVAGLYWLWVLPLFRPQRMCYVLDFCQIGQRAVTNRVQALKNWARNCCYQLWSRYNFDQACFYHEAGARKVLGPAWPRWATVVPMGVEPAFLSTPLPPLWEDDPNRPVRFVYIGRISQVRKLERILLAVQKVQAIAPAFQVDFIGPDLSGNYYQAMAKDLGVDGIVNFLPAIPYASIPETVLRYDAGIAYLPEVPVDWQYHPSLKVLEYRALGVPILASDNLPNRELVQDGVNGVLVQNTADAIAIGMLRFLAAPAFRHSCREQARALRRGIVWSEVAELYERLYAILIDTRATAQLELAVPTTSRFLETGCEHDEHH